MAIITKLKSVSKGLWCFSFPGEDTEGGDVKTPSITLNNINKNDKGSYVCNLTNEAGPAQSDPFDMDVLCEYLLNSQYYQHILK